jgi:hypothetical protein
MGWLQGHKKLGINRVPGATVYREWAPAAQVRCLPVVNPSMV